MESIDKVRDYWDNSPCFTKRSKAPWGSTQFNNETEIRKFTSEPQIPEFAEYGAWKWCQVLEIGCGIGIDSVNFAKAGAKVTAIDISRESLNLARMRAKDAGVSIDFRCFNAENIESAAMFDHRSAWLLGYDLVYAFGSIHHSPEPYKILKGARSVMKYGGTLKLMVYNKWSFKALWILLKYGKGKFWKFSELIARHSEAQTGCPITHVYSKRSIKRLVESAGFRVKKISIDHIFRFNIERYKKFEYELDWKFRWMPDFLFDWLQKRVGWHLLVECEA